MNKMLIILFSFILTSFEFCNDNSFYPGDMKYYEAYNLITLKGDVQLAKKNAVYPFVSIEDSSSAIVIKHYISKEVIYQSKYQKTGNVFKREYPYNIGMSSMLFDEYLLKDSMIVLQYNTSESKKLSSISVFSNNILKTYTLQKEIESTINVNTVKEYISSMSIYSTRTISFKKQNDSILVNMEFQNFELPELSYKKDIAFNSHNKSLDWWLIFKWESFSKSLLYLEDNFKKID